MFAFAGTEYLSTFSQSLLIFMPAASFFFAAIKSGIYARGLSSSMNLAKFAPRKSPANHVMSQKSSFQA